MKIVLIGRYNKNEKLNGPEKFAKRLFSELTSKNINVDFISYFFKESKGSYIKRLISKKELDVPETVLILGIIRIFFFLIKEQPEIIHIVTSDRFIIPIFFYKPFLKGKIFVTHHSILREELNKSGYQVRKAQWLKDFLLEKLFFEYADKHIFVSKLLLEKSIGYYLFDPKKCCVIPNGIDKIFVNKKKAIDIRKKLKILFYNGFNSSIERGLTEVISVLNKLAKYISIELIVIGEKSIEIKSVLFEISFKEQLTTTELSFIMKENDFLIKSTKFDSFPFMVVEAMAAGMVVIISSNVGAKDYINHGVNGLMYDKNSSDGLYNRLMEILNNRYNLNSISEEATKIYDILNWESVSKKYLEMYNS